MLSSGRPVRWPRFLINNGRQIRNNLWTAVRIAKYNRQRLSYSHLEQGVEISREFDDYLEKTRGGRTAEEDARVQELRHD